MPTTAATSASGENPSRRRTELLDAAYRYATKQGLADLSLRPLAHAIGSSPRVLIFLFGSKNGLIRAILAKARADELATLDRLPAEGAADLVTTAGRLWNWLSDPPHRGVLNLWVEAYARSLLDPQGPWAGFAEHTVTDWLDLLAESQPAGTRRGAAAVADRTAALAVLRGAMLDVLATGDVERTTRAVERQLATLSLTTAR